MNIDKEEYIKSLEERIEKLEKLFEHLCIDQYKEITLTRCSLGDIKLGDNCNITLSSCPVGGVISHKAEIAFYIFPSKGGTL